MRRGSRLLAFLPCLLALGCARRADRAAPLTISVPYEVDSLDPHARNLAGSFAIASHFYDPLVATDANLAIRPGLADRWDNPDALTWTFHLRPGVRFHSGKELTSQDVVHSFERLARRRDLEMSIYLNNVERVRATGPLTVEIRTKTPTGILLSGLRFVLIVPSGKPDASLASEPDGTGPYRPAEWSKGRQIRMVRNEAYWGGKPPLSEVTFRLDRNPEQALEDLRSRASAFIQCNSKKLDAIAGGEDLVVRRQTSIFVKYLSFDLSRDATPFCSETPNPFKRKKVREALDHAIDRSRLVSRLSTYAVPASQPVPPFIFGFNPAIPLPSFDPDLSRRLLREAGLPNGFDVTLHTRRIFEETATILVEMLGAVGIRVRVEVLSDPAFFDLVNRNQPSFVLTRRGCPTGDADILLQLFRPEGMGEGRRNIYQPENPELDRAIEASAEILDMDERRQALQKIMASVMDELVWIPLYIDEDVYAWRKGLTWQPRNDSYILASEIRPED